MRVLSRIAAFWLPAFSFVSVIIPIHCAAAAPAVVHIGVIAPLSGNGAHIGNEMTRTIQIMSKQLHKRGLKNRYEFVFEDGKAAVDNSPTSAAMKLIHTDDARFLITASSGETLQVGPIAEREHVILVGVFSSHKDIKSLGDYVFRTFPDVERGMLILSEFVRRNRQVPLALLTEDHPFNQGIKELLQRYLSDDLAYVEDYPLEDSDLRTILLKAKGRNPKAYYFNCSHPKTCALIVNQAKQLGIREQVYSYLHIDNPEFLTAAGANAEGVRFLSPPTVLDSSTLFEEFYSQYRAVYVEGPVNEFLMRTTFDAVSAVVDGIEAVGPDPAEVKRFLYAYKAEGALGTVSFDANGDIRGIEYVIKEIADGRPKDLN